MTPQNNFLEGMEREDVKVFKKRFIGSILATDMANHGADLAAFKQKLELNQIRPEANNSGLFLDRKS